MLHYVLAAVLVVAALGGPGLSVAAECVDVSLGPEYQAVAREHLPTLLHQSGSVFFPSHVCFDGDWDAENNREHYAAAVAEGNRPEPWVYVHILHSTEEQRTYVQYWYYYAYNDYINVHSDDWELVVVVLDEDLTPLALKTSGHGVLGGWVWLFGVQIAQFASWGQVEKAITPYENPDIHPLVYVDAGSHAGWVFAPWLNTPAWSIGAYTPWETQASGRCMFLGSLYEDPDMDSEGPDLLDFGGYSGSWWDGSAAFTDDEELALEFWHDVMGVAFLPSEYGEGGIVAPWRRPIWTSIGMWTLTY
jgi:hypothetical protein